MPDDHLPAGGSDGAALNAAVATEQFHLLLDNRADVPVNLINAGLTSVLLWGLFPGWARVSWLTSFCAVSAARALIRRRYAASQRDAGTALRWGRRFTVNAFVAGCLWGVTGSVILVTPDPLYHNFIIFVLGGTMAGGIVCIAAYLPAMFAFILPIMLPAIAALIVRGGLMQLAMAAMLGLFAAALALTGRSINRSIIGNIRMRIAQGELVAKLSVSETAMAEAQAIAHVGSLEIDVKNHSISCTAETLRIFGVDPATFKPSFDALIARIHPDDRAAVGKVFAEFVATGASNDLECRVVMDDGAIKTMHSVGRATFDAAHRPIRLFSTVQDITQRRQSESARALLATIVDSSDDAIVAETVAGEITSWNRGAEQIFGYRADEAIGQNVRFIVPDERRAEIDRDLATLARGERIESFDTERLRKDGTRIPVSIAVSLSRDDAGTVLGASFIARDIRAREQAAETLAYRDRLLHAAMVGTGMLVKAQSLELGMPDALRVVGESMHVDRVVVIQLVPGSVPPIALRHRWEAPDILIRITDTQLEFIPIESAVLAEWIVRLRDNKPLNFQVASSTGPIREMLQRFGNKSTLLVPIFVRDKFWGVIGADVCTVAREWDVSEIDMLRTFAGIAGTLIERSETWRALETSEGRYRVLNATAQDAIVTVDAGGLITQWNKAAERMFGYDAAEAIGKNGNTLLSTPSRDGEADAVRAAAHAGAGKTFDITLIKKDGVEIAVEISVSGALYGGHWETISILRDITERKKAQSTLAFANLLLKTQMEASLDGILIVDANMKIISINQRFIDMWKIAPQDLAAGDNTAVLGKVAALVRDPQTFHARVKYLYAHPGEDSHDEYQTTDGRFVDRYTVTLYLPGKEYLGRAWFFRDISELKRTEALALRMARFDVLTGLANRAVFVEALQHAIAAAKRGEKGFSLIYLDLDHFKDVNDTLGHPVGDEFLKAVADRLRSNTRTTDTVARFGGDEFAVVVADSGDPADAAILADKLIKAIGTPFSVQGSDIHSSASIGIATYGVEARNAETLLSHADVALYRAKSEGRGAYRFFTDAMDVEVQTRVRLGAELRTAIEAGELFLMYQPQVEMDSGEISGVEALLRWHHPRLGILGPMRFVPIAEQIGIIAKIGHWVLWTACRQGRAWIEAGIKPVRICVNASALQFRAPISLEADVAAALAETGLPAQRLELELTESVLMDASREHNDVIQRIRATGVTVAIDDFGTGYSSLEYLRRFPSDRIKIAQEFVTNLETAPGDAAIIRATIGLARELDITVIAEGVETVTQADLLKAWGCGEVQGFYFSKPLSVEDATVVLRAGVIRPPRAA